MESSGSARPQGRSQYTRLIQDAVAPDGGVGVGGAAPTRQRSLVDGSAASHSLDSWRRSKEPHSAPSSRRNSNANLQKAATEQAAARARRGSFGAGAAGERQGLGIGSLPQSALWVAPALALLVGLFAQNAGLYLGTRCYVKWMDELHRPRPNGTVAAAPGRAAVLLDVAWALPSPGQRLALLTRILDAATSLVPVVWFGWVARTRDLRLWTQVLLSCAVLALLKGFLAWSTVVPDAEGWEACRERLQEDGLKYYRRQLVGSSSSLGAREIDLSEALVDVLLLEVRGLWLLGAERRGRYCGGALPSGALCRAVLFCVGLGEAVRASTRQLQARARFACRTAAYCLLSCVVLGNTLLPLLNRYRYSADIFLALILAWLVYGNPAIAVAAQCWARGADAGMRESQRPRPTRDAVAEALGAGERRAAPAERARGQDGLPEEQGRVPLLPCCLLLPGSPPLENAYLRAGAVQLPTEEIGKELRQLQVDHLRSIKAQLIRCRKLKEEQIVQVHTEALCRAAAAEGEAQQRLEERLAEQARTLEAEERRFLEEDSLAPERTAEGQPAFSQDSLAPERTAEGQPAFSQASLAYSISP